MQDLVFTSTMRTTYAEKESVFTWFCVECLVFQVWCLVFRVQGLGFRVQGSGFRVWG